MKVYGIPDAVPFAEPDYANYDSDAELARVEQHKADLKQHLIEMGYTGEHTGGIASFLVGDGFAQYMLADGNGRYGRTCLFHLPYNAGYHFRYVSKLSKKEIVEEIEAEQRRAALFRPIF